MSDKLLVEIDMFNGELNDAVPALIFLANELVESGTIEITQPINWNERVGNAYQVKWRFAEDELHLPLDIDFLYQLTGELETLSHTIPNDENSAIACLKDKLEKCMASVGMSLFSEPEMA